MTTVTSLPTDAQILTALQEKQAAARSEEADAVDNLRSVCEEYINEFVDETAVITAAERVQQAVKAAQKAETALYAFEQTLPD